MAAFVPFVAAAAAWFCGVQPALAVPPGQVSFTAEAVCAYRAIAAQHTDPKLRNPDDLADKPCRSSTVLPREYASARQFIDQSGEMYAPYFFVNARTHDIDATLQRAAAFAKRQGLQVIEDVGPKELARRHLLGSDGKPDGRMIDWSRIIEAKVP